MNTCSGYVKGVFDRRIAALEDQAVQAVKNTPPAMRVRLATVVSDGQVIPGRTLLEITSENDIAYSASWHVSTREGRLVSGFMTERVKIVPAATPVYKARISIQSDRVEEEYIELNFRYESVHSPELGNSTHGHADEPDGIIRVMVMREQQWPTVQVPENPAGGRDCVVGDVHGEFPTLEAALAHVEFAPERDRLFALGDLVDRDPHSVDALAWMTSGRIALSVRGNHEQVLLRRIEVTETHPGEPTWSMHPWFAREVDDRADWGRWKAMIRAMPIAATVHTRAGDVGLVHATPTARHWDTMLADLAAGDADTMWQAIHSTARARNDARRAEYEETPADGAIDGVRAVLTGHTIVPDPTTPQKVWHIDTGVGFGGQAVGGSMPVRRPSGLANLVLHVTPVKDREGAYRSRGVAALVLIVDPAARAGVEPALVQRVFGLTPVESEIAMLLAEGLSAPPIAAATGRGYGTVRTHVKHMFAKLGVSRQVEVVQLVLALLSFPPSRDQGARAAGIGVRARGVRAPGRELRAGNRERASLQRPAGPAMHRGGAPPRCPTGLPLPTLGVPRVRAAGCRQHAAARDGARKGARPRKCSDISQLGDARRAAVP